MTSTTVTGRVRATLRLKTPGGACVVATSWASDRAFPRTTGAAVPFELETSDGAVYRVDPFEALVTVPVREAGAREGARHEEAWIAAGDEITVEGELERGGRGRLPPALLARRIATSVPGGAPLHRLPPRALQRGEGEEIEAPEPAVTTVTTVAVGGEPPTESNDGTARRPPKKKRPDPNGTPPPVT